MSPGAKLEEGRSPVGGSPLDRREGVRREVNQEFASVEHFISEYISNLSRTGAFIRTDQPLEVGTRVTLRFTIVVDDLETLVGEGRVVRVILPGGSEPAGMGVVFTQLPPLSARLIERMMVRP